MPALQSLHATVPGVSVAAVMDGIIDNFLQPQLTRAGAAEREKLSQLLEHVHTPEPRRRRPAVPPGKLARATHQDLSALSDTEGRRRHRDMRVLQIRVAEQNRASPRVQFFIWLLVQERI
jgi:hypothetical protein